MNPLLKIILASVCVTLAVVMAMAQPGSGAGGYGSVGPGGGGGGPTNGQTASQVSAAILGGAIIQTNGTGTNTSLGTLTVLSGKYKTFDFANGSHLRTNTIAPFDWEFHNTNGTVTWGTNNVTKVTADNLGNVSYPSANGGIITAKNFNAVQSLNVANNQFTINQNAAIVNTLMAAGTGLSNMLFIDSAGLWNTNDAQIWSNIVSNNAVSGLPNRTNFYNVTNATAGNALVVVGPDASGNFSAKGTNWPTGGGSVPNGLVTNGANFDISVNSGAVLLRANDGSVIGSYGRFAQVALTNNTDTSSQVRLTQDTNAAGAVLEIEGATNSTTSPVTLKGAGGIIIEALQGTFSGGGNVSIIPTNAALFGSPVVTIAIGTKLTNTWNARADVEIVPVYNDVIGGAPLLNYKRGTTTTNFNVTFNPFSGISANASFTNQPLVIVDFGTNEWILLSDVSTTTATVGVFTNMVHLK